MSIDSYELLWRSLGRDSLCLRLWLQARLANTQTAQDLLKLTETLQSEKSRLQSRQQRDAAEALKLQQALAELRAAHSMLKAGRLHQHDHPETRQEFLTLDLKPAHAQLRVCAAELHEPLHVRLLHGQSRQRHPLIPARPAWPACIPCRPLGTNI